MEPHCYKRHSYFACYTFYIAQCFLPQYDLPAEATIAGLNVIGKLYVPPNYKSTLRTPYVFVQGELEMSDTNVIAPENQSIKIVLTGTTSVTFRPADSNAGVAGTPFNAGIKPFLVAGGKLIIRGWDESQEQGIATWTPLISMAEGDRPKPTLKSSLVPTPQVRSRLYGTECPRQIVNHDFNVDVDYSLWSGGEGAIVTHDPISGTITLSNLQKNWQGFRLDFTKLAKDCPLIQDAIYLITMRLKVDKEGAEGQKMECETTNDRWGKCMRLTRKIMRKVGSDRHSIQMVRAGNLLSLNASCQNS